MENKERYAFVVGVFIDCQAVYHPFSIGHAQKMKYHLGMTQMWF